MSTITTFTGSIPVNYETYLAPLFFEPYAVDLVQRLQGNSQVLELACGTGRVTKHLVNKMTAGGRLVATDLNADMLQVAKQTIKNDRIEWLVADAHDLPFAPEVFDLVICQYGVMFFGDKPAAMREVFRVLKKGGAFVFNTWNRVETNALALVTKEVLSQIFPHDPKVFFEKGPYSFFDLGHISRLLQDAGFVHSKTETVVKTSTAATPDDAVRGILDGTPLRIFLNEHAPQESEVRQRMRERLAQQFGEQNLALPMEAFVITATKL